MLTTKEERAERRGVVRYNGSMNENRAELVVDISKRFMDLLRQLDPRWKAGYLRFEMDSMRQGCTASYDIGSDVLLIAAAENAAFFDHIGKQGRKFLHNLGKAKGVFLLVVDSSCKYNFYFEFEDLERWTISISGGSTGRPVDLPG
jgi:hypothetical protein